MSAHTETEKITVPLRQALSCWLQNTDISVSNSSREEICVQTVENLRGKKKRKAGVESEVPRLVRESNTKKPNRLE